MQYNSINYVPKIEPDSLEVLSLIYTPGVGHACMKIKEQAGLSYVYTNRENSVAVLSFDYEKSLKRAIFLKSTLNIDAYPFEANIPSPLEGERSSGGELQGVIKLVVENISPNFCGIDLTLITDEVKNIEFDVEIPVLKSTCAGNTPHPNPPPQGGREQTAAVEPIPKSGVDIMDFFKPFSKNIFQFDINQLEGDFKEQALYLREKAGGVIESQLSEEPFVYPPVAIISDGSAVLGFGNIGPEAGLPVMEGKAVIFKSLGGVNAIPLCLKTQKSGEIIKIVQALKNSFSGINLEDISAPRCFDIEKELIKTLDIPVFHDDQHGTAIVVLAALLNSLTLAKKKIAKVKIVFSGAGAAAQAVSKLLMKAGAKDIIHVNKNGIVNENSAQGDNYLKELAKVTNKEGLEGKLEDALKGADVFIGLSAGGVLKSEFIKQMAESPIIFALANPTPEIMPNEAKAAGAFIVATGRSDFDNQINNSLVFPGLFRGVLDNGIKKITDEIKLGCAIALASLIKDEDLSPTNILPNALDPRVVLAVASRLAEFT
ncbi:MAG: malic enzyme-like NAD(P)-binding protein [Candidatus Gastranaerophilaceae bacterium]